MFDALFTSDALLLLILPVGLLLLAADLATAPRATEPPEAPPRGVNQPASARRTAA
jgi:hypothetical protein